MAFALTKEVFGAYERVRLHDEATGCSLAFLPDYGSYVTELVFEKNGVSHSILDGYGSAAGMEQDPYYRSAFLLPFPNRLADGVYWFENKRYELGVNEPATGNNLHGFKAFYKGEVVDSVLEKDWAAVSIVHRYGGEGAGFPFAFELTVRYELRTAGVFDCTMRVHNTGAVAMPLGLGWHPYFRVQGDLAGWQLQLPELEEVLVDERMLPTGALRSLVGFERLASIGTRSFDTCFKLRDGGSPARVRLVSADGQVQVDYYQETGYQKFNHLQLFIPPTRDALAIEPMTCNINAFATGDGLVVLEPKAILEAQAGVQLTVLG